MLMTIWENILKPLSVVSKILKPPQTNFHKASDVLQETIISIENMIYNYDKHVVIKTELCLKWGILQNLIAAKYIQTNNLDRFKRL